MPSFPLELRLAAAQSTIDTCQIKTKHINTINVTKNNLNHVIFDFFFPSSFSKYISKSIRFHLFIYVKNFDVIRVVFFCIPTFELLILLTKTRSRKEKREVFIYFFIFIIKRETAKNCFYNYLNSLSDISIYRN